MRRRRQASSVVSVDSLAISPDLLNKVETSTTPDKNDEVARLLAPLKNRSYKTYLSRLHASNRLSARHRAWNTSLISMSAAVTIASIGLLSEPDLYGTAGATLLVCSSVVTLIVSLVTSSVDYSGRSRNMFLNYRRIQRLSAEVERLTLSPGGCALEDIARLNERYDALLDESENHTEADYHRTSLEVKRTASTIWENLFSILPYFFLLAPLGLLIPLAKWVLSGF